MVERDGEVTRVLKRVAQTLGNGKFDEALRDLLHLSEKYPDAGEIRPQIAEVLLRRGQSRVRKGKLKEGRDDLERSLKWSQKPEAMVTLARSLMDEGNLDSADRLLNAALEADDAFGPTHEAIGMLFMKWQEYSEAARAFEQALGLGHATPAMYVAVWDAYLRLERFDRAHDLVMEGVERFPDSDVIQAAAGDSYVYAKGESAAARPYWARAAELNPKNFGAIFNLAADAAAREERAESLQFLKRAAELDLERARRLWLGDMASPLRKFAAYARDAEFRRALGWQND
jgi:tetratricopeptide (TPR) repeat protein